MNEIISLLSMGLAMATPLILCTLGGIFTYKAGVLNIALEGMMTMGAFGSILFIFYTKNILLGCILGIGMSVLFGLIFSVFSITLKGNNIITGLAINMLASGVTPFLLLRLFGNRTSLIITDLVDPSVMQLDVPILRSIPVLGDILNKQTPLTYLSLVLIAVLSVVLYKTKFGVYTRVCGENKDAAEAVGIKVALVKYGAVAVSAVASALAGINLAVENLGMYTNNMASGRGFICLAAIYCGKGRPSHCVLYAIIFGMTKALQVKLTTMVNPATASLIETLPYLMIVAVMFLTAMLDMKRRSLRGFKNE